MISFFKKGLVFVALCGTEVWAHRRRWSTTRRWRRPPEVRYLRYLRCASQSASKVRWSQCLAALPLTTSAYSSEVKKTFTFEQLRDEVWDAVWWCLISLMCLMRWMMLNVCLCGHCFLSWLCLTVQRFGARPAPNLRRWPKLLDVWHQKELAEQTVQLAETKPPQRSYGFLSRLPQKRRWCETGKICHIL